MTALNYLGFHTCKLDGGYDHVKASIPFLSKPTKNQWLTQGFYFWTDSVYWAKKWGQKGNRAIGQFSVTLCPKTELLDLVGNVDDQLEFVKYRDKVIDYLNVHHKNKVTVNQLVSYLRKKEEAANGFFPYLAIKAEDGRSKCQMSFIDPAMDKYENKQRLVTPQQLCVFEKAKSRITLNGFVEPQEFMENFSPND
ncbi:hypothetical protein KW471_00690 [Vibrio fluvialis]|nr:hypothetical protein [Vibrio fluvialis]